MQQACGALSATHRTKNKEDPLMVTSKPINARPLKLANVIRKLNANNRTHAIVLGMHLAMTPRELVNG